MKTATLDELRSNNELLRHGEAIVLKDGLKTLGVFHPLPDPDESIPLEKRREVYLVKARALREKLKARGVTEEHLERDIAALFDDRR